MERSPNCKVILVGFKSPISILFKRDKGNKLTLAPRSHRAFSIVSFPITQGMEKLLGSLSFGGNFFCMTALHSLVRVIVSLSSIFLFFYKISFKRHLRQSFSKRNTDVYFFQHVYKLFKLCIQVRFKTPLWQRNFWLIRCWNNWLLTLFYGFLTLWLINLFLNLTSRGFPYGVL